MSFINNNEVCHSETNLALTYNSYTSYKQVNAKDPISLVPHGRHITRRRTWSPPYCVIHWSITSPFVSKGGADLPSFSCGDRRVCTINWLLQIKNSHFVLFHVIVKIIFSFSLKKGKVYKYQNAKLIFTSVQMLICFMCTKSI